MNALNTLTITLAMLLTGQTLVFAQNPLRAAPQGTRSDSSYYRSGSQATIIPTYAQDQPIQSPRDSRVDPRGNRRSASSNLELPPIYDNRVAPANYEQRTGPVARTAAQNQDGRQADRTNVLAAKNEWLDHNRVLDLIMKITINLALVLSFAVGVILIAKRWVKPKTSDGGGGRLPSDALSIRETLRLDGKTTIRLVQWRSNRFLVACDQNGIQSVNALNDSFDQTMKELDEDLVDDQLIDDKLIRKLLSNMDLNKT